MNMKLLSVVALLVCGVGSQVNAAAVFPQIDGGAFDALANDLDFTVAGTFDDVDTSGDFSTGDILDLTYTLTGNSGGPVIDLSVDLSGTLAASGSSFVFSSSTVTLLGAGTPEITLTPVLMNISDPTIFGSFDLVLGLDAATIDPPIDAGSVNFLPVGFGGGVGTVLGEYDFTLASASAVGGTILNVNFGTGAVSGTALGVVNPIPEPASMLTLLGCVTGACVMGRRRRKAAAAA